MRVSLCLHLQTESKNVTFSPSKKTVWMVYRGIDMSHTSELFVHASPANADNAILLLLRMF